MRKQNLSENSTKETFPTQTFDFSLLKKFETKKFDPGKFKIAIVQSRFNENICSNFSAVCLNQLIYGGVSPQNVSFTTVSGALEIPITLKHLAKNMQFNAMIAIGTIIRGETYHFDIVANESARCISNLALELNIPIINAILTTENEDQAYARIIEKAQEAANIAIEMSSLMESINGILAP